MWTPISIIAGAALIAGAMLLNNHWTVTSPNAAFAVRINNWTGAIERCVHDSAGYECEDHPAVVAKDDWAPVSGVDPWAAWKPEKPAGLSDKEVGLVPQSR